MILDNVITLVPQLAIDFVKDYEGLSLEAYECAGGRWTVGYGHTRTATPISKITKEEAERLLKGDLYSIAMGVKRLIKVELNLHQYCALLSFTFNLGLGSLQRSTLRQKLNRGEYEEAADEFLKWVYAKGKILRGLEKRRKAERELFLTPVIDEKKDEI